MMELTTSVGFGISLLLTAAAWAFANWFESPYDDEDEPGMVWVSGQIMEDGQCQ